VPPLRGRLLVWLLLLELVLEILNASMRLRLWLCVLPMLCFFRGVTAKLGACTKRACPPGVRLKQTLVIIAFRPSSVDRLSSRGCLPKSCPVKYRMSLLRPALFWSCQRTRTRMSEATTAPQPFRCPHRVVASKQHDDAASKNIRRPPRVNQATSNNRIVPFLLALSRVVPLDSPATPGCAGSAI
jgi:hypothetical protein